MSKLSSKYKTGEVAKALVMEWFRDWGSEANAPSPAFEATAERLIKHLEENKFVIAPRPYSRPARRGRSSGNTKPKPYTGPDWIGTTHSAKLAGQ